MNLPNFYPTHSFELSTDAPESTSLPSTLSLNAIRRLTGITEARVSIIRGSVKVGLCEAPTQETLDLVLAMQEFLGSLNVAK